MFDFEQLGIDMGQLLGQLYRSYTATFAWLAPILHLAVLLVLYLVIRYGNRYRTAFTVYFLLNYLWGFLFVGVWTTVHLVQRLGVNVLLLYGATPVFLLLISYQLYHELRHPRLDLHLSTIGWWRYLIAVPMMVWALWYPPYTWGVGFDFDLSAFLFGDYGLMTCPLTMMALSVLFLKYPAGNKPLFHLLTAYAVFGGAGMVATQWVPDIPFFVIGLASLALIIGVKLMKQFPKGTPASPSSV